MGTEDRDQFSDLLDGALRRYASVEPAAGLERRVLTNLCLHERCSRAKRRWALLSSPVFAVLLIALVWLGHRTLMEDPIQKSPSRTAQVLPVEQAVETRSQASPPVAKDLSVLRTSRYPAHVKVPPSEPRLKRFPSARPLSPEEAVIAEYAVRFPQEAALIVKEQQGFDEQIRVARREIEARSGISNE